MNLSNAKVMLYERAITSTFTVDGNVIEKVDRCVYLGKTVTQAGDLLPGIKRRIALGSAAFGKVANIMKCMKASMKIKRKIQNEYVLSVMVYGSEKWALKNNNNNNSIYLYSAISPELKFCSEALVTTLA